MKFEIKKGTPEISEELSDLAVRSKSHWPYEKDFIEKCREGLSITNSHFKDDLLYVGKNEIKIIGFYSFIIKNKLAEMEHLFVDPSYIGHGFGRKEKFQKVVDLKKET